MKRLLCVLPLAVAVSLLGLLGMTVQGQQPEEFGVLRTSPLPSSATSPQVRPASQLPAGVEPQRDPASQTAEAAVTFNNPFPLTPQAGQWLICAATYIGFDGPELAVQVAQELRSKHRLQSFIYNRGDEERKKLHEEWLAMQKKYPGVPVKRKTYRIQDNYAVLVGGFKDFDSASAYRPKIQALPLPTLKLASGKSAYDLMTYQEMDKDKKTATTKQAPVNPFTSAMVVRNPLVSASAPNKPRWDPFWKTLNANEEYSMLKNPKPWTLVVKEYAGARTLQSRENTKSSFLSAFGLGNSRADTLDAAAAQAHELAKFLRHPTFGMETWVLHTRYSSVVSVGGYSGPEDPEMQRMIARLTNLKFASGEKKSDPVQLMPTPMPVEVPRP